MTDATRRGIRSTYQALLALCTVVPAWLALLPAGSPLALRLAGAAAAVGAVSAAVNKAEEAGLLPAWLKAEREPVEPAWAEAVDDAPGEH